MPPPPMQISQQPAYYPSPPMPMSHQHPPMPHNDPFDLANPVNNPGLPPPPNFLTRPNVPMTPIHPPTPAYQPQQHYSAQMPGYQGYNSGYAP